MSSAVRRSVQARTSAIGKIRRPALLSAFGHVLVGELRADDGADRDCRRLDRMHSGPHAQQRQCDHGDQAGPLAVSLTLCCCLPASAHTGRAWKAVGRGLNAEIEEPLVVDLQPERGRFLVPQIGCCMHIPVRRQFSSPILVSRCEVLFWTSKAFWKSESGFPRGAPFLSIKLPQPMTRRFHQTRQP